MCARSHYVWYAEGAQHKPFLKKLYKLIEPDGKTAPKKPRGKTEGKKGGGAGWQLDPRRRVQIETAAITEVIQYYEALDYAIRDRQNEHCGWDLEATKDGAVLYLEVKGIAGSTIDAELSSNEYEHLKKHRSLYRVCIVTDALTTPKLSIYGYVAGSKRWEHHKDGTPIQIEPVWVQTARVHL